MKLIYVYHSCYAILSDDKTIIIDYYQDSDSKNGVVHSDLLERDTELYVLCTHSHHDHYNSEILKWREAKPDIHYIFSQEIADSLRINAFNENHIHFLDKLESYENEHIKVKAFGSTDAGGSFLINTNGKSIFHAGDLNNWHWNQHEESTPDEIVEAEEWYRTELALLAHDVKQLDLAMLPIDPRLGTDFMKGGQEFLEAIETDWIAPMHFGEEYSTIAQFQTIANKYKAQYFSVTSKNQSINF